MDTLGKNILIFADGTGQVGGLRPDQRMTNIYKLYRAMRSGPDSAIDPRDQIAFYDPGIGTSTSAGGVSQNWIDVVGSVLSMATGLGFSRNVVDCYEAILRHHRTGDRIYLLGFSRGAYTVRAVANVLNLCGIPTHDSQGLPLPAAGKALRSIAEEAVHKVYNHGAGSQRERYEEQREEHARQFRKRYGAGNDPDRGDVTPEGVAIFDAVAALGFSTPVKVVYITLFLLLASTVAALVSRWIASGTGASFTALFVVLVAIMLLGVANWVSARTVHYPPEGGLKPRRRHYAIWSGKHYDRYLDRRIPFVRHALSIDEDRKHFPRVDWGSKGMDYGQCERTGNKRFVQMWFAGNHSDVGGSYPEDESRLSDISLGWIVEELKAHDPTLQFDATKLQLFPDARGMQHSEIALLEERWPTFMRMFGNSLHGTRAIHPQADLHPTVLERLREPTVQRYAQYLPYRPPSLAAHESCSTPNTSE